MKCQTTMEPEQIYRRWARDRSCGCGEVQNEEPLFDPMAELHEIEDSPPLETPKEEATIENKCTEALNVANGAHAKTTALRSM